MKKTIFNGILAVGILLMMNSGIQAEASQATSDSADTAVSNSASSSASAVSDGQTTPAASEVQAAAPEAAASNPAGTYVAYDEERYPDDRAPTLELSEGGGFVFRTNLGDGRLAVMTGTYVNNGGTLAMEVLYSDSTDFLGDDVMALSFTQEGTTELNYAGEPLGMTRAGDIFTSTATAGNTGALGQNLYILAPGEVVEL